MTAEKLQRILQRLILSGQKARGIFILGTGSGDLRFSTSSQLGFATHTWMLKHGFVCVDGDYIYRPNK